MIICHNITSLAIFKTIRLSWKFRVVLKTIRRTTSGLRRLFLIQNMTLTKRTRDSRDFNKKRVIHTYKNSPQSSK